jgi:hypothetical protein
MKKLILIFLLIPVIGFSQGKLNQAKNNLSSKSKSKSKSSSSGGSSGSRKVDLNAGRAFVKLFFYAPKIVIGGIYITVFGTSERRHFSPYPYYYSNVQGEYDFGLETEDKKNLISAGVNYLSGNYINSAEANVNYRFLPFLGVDLSHQSFFEDRPNGSDRLDVTSLMVNYYRIRERSFTGWWGIGATYVGSEVNTYGFTYNIGLEVYPVKPISFLVSYKQSFINQSHINVTKYQTKYHRKKMAYYIGYHNISIAGVKASGMVLGVEASF